MTDKAKRNSKPLRAAQAVDKIRELLSDQQQRIDAAARDIRSADSKRTAIILSRVRAGMEREDAETMLKALGIHVPPLDPHFDDIPDAPDETPSRPTLEEYDVGVALDAVPERLREPLPEARLAIGRKQ